MNVEMFKMMGAAGASNASCLGAYAKLSFVCQNCRGYIPNPVDDKER